MRALLLMAQGALAIRIGCHPTSPPAADHAVAAPAAAVRRASVPDWERAVLEAEAVERAWREKPWTDWPEQESERKSASAIAIVRGLGPDTPRLIEALCRAARLALDDDREELLRRGIAAAEARAPVRPASAYRSLRDRSVEYSIDVSFGAGLKRKIEGSSVISPARLDCDRFDAAAFRLELADLFVTEDLGRAYQSPRGRPPKSSRTLWEQARAEFFQLVDKVEEVAPEDDRIAAALADASLEYCYAEGGPLRRKRCEPTERALRRSLELRRKSGAVDLARRSQLNLAEWLDEQHRTSEAEALYADLATEFVETRTPIALRSAFLQAGIRAAKGDVEGFERIGGAFVALSRRPDADRLYLPLEPIARIATYLSRHSLAERVRERQVAMSPHEDHPAYGVRLAEIRVERAALLERLHREHEALAEYDAAIRAMESAIPAFSEQSKPALKETVSDYRRRSERLRLKLDRRAL